MLSNLINYHARRKGFTLVFVMLFMVLIISFLTILYSQSEANLTRNTRLLEQTQALALAEAGIDKATHELSYNSGYAGETDLTLAPNPGVAEVSITNVSETVKTITSQAFIPDKNNPRVTRKLQVGVEGSPDVAGSVFSFAIQSGNGGFQAHDNAQIFGSLYSNQNIDIRGPGARVTGDATAVGQVILTKTGSVEGTVTENAPQSTLPPIDFTDWQNQASQGLTHNGDLVVNSNITLGGEGNISIISGQLKVPSNATITLKGPVWVKGQIANIGLSIEQNATFVIDASLADTKTVLMVDYKIDVTGNTSFVTNKPNAWTLLVSTYTENLDPNNTVININSNSKFTNAVVYAFNGGLTLNSNSSASSARAFIGQKITVIGNTRIEYDSGLATISFENSTSGPSGGYKPIAGTFSEVK